MTTTPKTVSDWLTYMGSIHVSAIDMGLERVLPVAEQLGILKHQLSKTPYVFTIAGTNGKGSTTALISEICTKAGYKTALYQSPHLISFNERIKINGVDIDDEMLIKAFNECENARQHCNISLSFFEMTTLSAFWIFKQLNCDVWVLEIGLGGRLDVVNIIDPDMCVITNVGIDHTDWLGDTREKIGFEKAGILRQDSTLIFGETDMPNSVQNAIEQMNGTCYRYSKDYIYHKNSDDTWIYSGASITLMLPMPSISLLNASHAISSILASPLDIGIDKIKHALSDVKLAGRFDKRMLNERQWVFDVGHNEHGIKFLMSAFVPFWQDFKTKHPTANLHFLFSMLADKDIDKVVSLIATYDLPIHAWHIGKIDNARAIDTAQLHDKIIANSRNTPNIVTYDTITLATDGMINKTNKNDVILCFGSFHTIGESLIALGIAANPKTN